MPMPNDLWERVGVERESGGGFEFFPESLQHYLDDERGHRVVQTTDKEKSHPSHKS